MIAFLLGIGYCIVENRNVVLTIALVFAALLAGLSWRMRGKWGIAAKWTGGDASVGGEFADPFGSEPQRLSKPAGRQALPPAPDQNPAQSRARKPTPKGQSPER